MIATTYQDASQFLLKTRAALERNEAANNLMLGICLRLKRLPEKIEIPPCFVTVGGGNKLVAAAVMTPPHNLVIYSEQRDCVQTLEIMAYGLLSNHWLVPGVLGPSRAAKEFAAIWAKVSGVKYTAGIHQRIYELKKVIPPPSNRGKLRLATKNEVELVAQWAFAFQEEVLTGGDMAQAQEMAENSISSQDIYIWDDKQPVSMAARTRPTANGIGVSLVYTPPEFRGRGYAIACVANLSQLLLDSGRQFCALFADLANPISNHIYQKIGYSPVCDFNEYVFDIASL